VRERPAGDVDYETTGHGYAQHRQPDPRIEELVRAALGDSKRILNVGAGSGSYEPADREVTAVEPSATMRAQRAPHLAPAIDAVAERLPFPDDSFDAAMAMITIHQWTNPDLGLRELRRVSRGPVVILTFDGTALDRLWLGDYAPELVALERPRYPAISHIRRVLGGVSTVLEVPVPIDCVDGFIEAYYARPERFLDPDVRAAQSAWQRMDPAAIDRAIERLRADLESGEWDRRYGKLREQPMFTGALRLVTALPGRR
jgi:ubiquinone/menaquinone biosynthesis C-methylase UbiE